MMVVLFWWLWKCEKIILNKSISRTKRCYLFETSLVRFLDWLFNFEYLFYVKKSKRLEIGYKNMKNLNKWKL